MHLEISLENKHLTAYGGDVKINDSEVQINSTVFYQYGDKISLRNKNFVVFENEERKEEKELPLIVSDENSNQSKDCLQISEDFVCEKFEVSRESGNTEAGDLSKENHPGESMKTLEDKNLENSERPSFFNESTSSVEFAITKEKTAVEEEIRRNIEIGKENADVSIQCKKEKPMDLKEAIIEKVILEGISTESNKASGEDIKKTSENGKEGNEAVEIEEQCIKEEIKEEESKIEESGLCSSKNMEGVDNPELGKQSLLKEEKKDSMGPVKKRVRLASAASPSRAMNIESREAFSPTRKPRKVAVKEKSDKKKLSERKEAPKKKNRKKN